MPRHETTPTHGFEEGAPSVPQYQPQVILTHEGEEYNQNREIMTSSPTNNAPPLLSSSPDSGEDILSQLDEAIDTLNTKPSVPVHRSVRPQSTESILFCNDFGMNELMVMIRGAAATAKNKSKEDTKKNSIQIRSEISDVFKDSQTRLDQLEKVIIIIIVFYKQKDSLFIYFKGTGSSDV